MGWIVSDDEYWPSSDILAWDNSVEVDKRKLALHSEAQSTIIWMVSVRPTIAITEETIDAEGVIVRTLGSSCNRKRNLAEHLRLEYALRSHQRDSGAIEGQALRKKCSRQDISVNGYLLTKPLERGCPDSRVVSAIKHAEGSIAKPF